jgi:hypothetical protein
VFVPEEIFGLPARFLQIALIRDAVALEHVTRPVTSDLHDHGFDHPNPAKVPGPQYVSHSWKSRPGRSARAHADELRTVSETVG